jgi:hypothetical protein
MTRRAEVFSVTLFAFGAFGTIATAQNAVAGPQRDGDPSCAEIMQVLARTNENAAKTVSVSEDHERICSAAFQYAGLYNTKCAAKGPQARPSPTCKTLRERLRELLEKDGLPQPSAVGQSWPPGATQPNDAGSFGSMNALPGEAAPQRPSREAAPNSTVTMRDPPAARGTPGRNPPDSVVTSPNSLSSANQTSRAPFRSTVSPSNSTPSVGLSSGGGKAEDILNTKQFSGELSPAPKTSSVAAPASSGTGAAAGSPGTASGIDPTTLGGAARQSSVSEAGATSNGTPAVADNSGDKSLFERQHQALERAQQNGNVGGSSPDKGAAPLSTEQDGKATTTAGERGLAGETAPSAPRTAGAPANETASDAGKPATVSNFAGAPTDAATSGGPNSPDSSGLSNASTDGSKLGGNPVGEVAYSKGPETSPGSFPFSGELAPIPGGPYLGLCQDGDAQCDSLVKEAEELLKPASNGPDPAKDAPLANPIDPDKPALQAGADLPDIEYKQVKKVTMAPAGQPAASTPETVPAPPPSYPSSAYPPTSAASGGISADQALGLANTALGLALTASSLYSLGHAASGVRYTAPTYSYPAATAPTPPSYNRGGSANSGGSSMKVDCSLLRNC